MGLRAKVTLLLLLALVLTLAGAMQVNRLLVLPQLREAEARADRLDVHRIELGLAIVRRSLSNQAWDYAVWDDMVDYLRDGNPEFVARNFLDTMLVSPDIHGVAIVSGRDKLMFRREVDLATGHGVAQPLLAIEELLDTLPAELPPEGAPPVTSAGLRRGSAVPFLFAVASIKRSDTSGDSPGWVVFYRFIDETLRKRVSESMQLDFSAVEATPADPPDSEQRDEQDRMHWTLRADDGTPLYRLTVQLSPSVIDSGNFPLWVQAALVVGIVVFGVILVGLEWEVLRPVLDMATHLSRVRQNSNYALRLLPRGQDELAVLGRECDSLISYVEAQHAQLRESSTRDALTGVANRRVFDERLAELTLVASRRESPLALLMCDIDAFKAYNDRLGHPAGDEVLRRFGVLLAASDVRRSDVACRYGGEEFAVLLPDTGEQGAQLVAARLHEGLAELAIEHPANPGGEYVTVSIGVAVLEPDPSGQPAPEATRDLVKHADQALYEAKRAGRNRTVIYAST